MTRAATGMRASPLVCTWPLTMAESISSRLAFFSLPSTSLYSSTSVFLLFLISTSACCLPTSVSLLFTPSLFCIYFSLYPLWTLRPSRQIRFRLDQLAAAHLMPRGLNNVRSVLAQKYDGDITIVPDMTIEDYM